MRFPFYLELKNPCFFLSAAILLILFSCQKEKSGEIPKEVIAEYIRGRNLYAKGNFGEAAKVFSSLSGNKHRLPQAVFMKGKSLFMAGEMISAEKIFRSLSKTVPCYFEADFWHARTLAQMGKEKEAVKAFQRILGFDNRDPRVLYQLALLALQAEDLPKALEYLKLASEFSVEFSLIYLHIGRIYYQYGQMEKSATYLAAARTMLPEGDPYKQTVEDLIRKIEEGKN